MSSDLQLIENLYDYTDTDPNLKDPDTAHLVINGNHVLGMHGLPGLNIEVEELADGIDMAMKLDDDIVIEKDVHLCFGVLPETGVQRINMDVEIGRNARISLLAHCVFPKAVDVQHIMEAKIRIGEGAEYVYFEKHVHSPQGGIKVYPKAVIDIGEKAVYKTEFELIRGRVGLIDIDYECNGAADSVIDMMARISGRGDDMIKISETGHLNGDRARGALVSKIAVRDRARAEIYSKMTANGAYARGHVDCKEIVQDEGVATAIPIVEVNNPKAHITHEAAIGSVDSRQLETLMARGLSEDDAVEIIINGLLRRR